MTSRTERLRRLAAIGMLAPSYAHEFNNVLGGILGPAQLLAMRSTDPDLRERLETIVRSVQRGIALTTALARTARDGNGGSRTLDVHALLSALAAEAALPAGTTLSLAAAKATVGADGDALAESLLALAAAAAGDQPLAIVTANTGDAAGWLRIDLTGQVESTLAARRLIEDPLSLGAGEHELLIAGAAAVVRQSRGRIAFGEGAAPARIEIYLPTA